MNATATPVDYFATGRKAVFILIEVCQNDLDAVERIINDTEAALTDATRANGKKHCFAMRIALKDVRTAHNNVKGLLDIASGDAGLVRGVIATDEQAAEKGGYLSPKRKFYYQAQRWALDLLAA